MPLHKQEYYCPSCRRAFFYSSQRDAAYVWAKRRYDDQRFRSHNDRFAASRERYENLFWSHFQAAIDWDDAEMWLEGAAQNGWSVADMRRTRWETLGAVAGDAPPDKRIIEADKDEDYDSESDSQDRPEYVDDGESSLIAEGADFGEEPWDRQADGSGDSSDESRGTDSIVRPFEKLAELPPDFADAFDSFKLSILRHKSEGWVQIARDDVLGALNALKELAIAPTGEEGS